MTVPVLLRTGNARQLIYLPIDENQTASDLIGAVAVQQQIPAASIEQVTYQDQVLADRQQLAAAGVNSARATIQGSCSLLFPNNWFESPYARCFVRALDISWPPLRQADYDTGFTWLLLLLGLLAAINSALAA